MLALFEYFWDPTTWVAGPPPPAPAPPQVATGPSSGKGFKPDREAYVRAGEDFWEIREAYLLNHLPDEVLAQEVAVANAEEEDKINTLILAKNEAYSRAKVARNQIELVTEVSRVKELTLQILALRSQYDEEAVLILLLDS